MSVVGKLATCILNNAYVCLVNKLFKDDLISKKKKGGGRIPIYNLSKLNCFKHIKEKHL